MKTFPQLGLTRYNSRMIATEWLGFIIFFIVKFSIVH